MPKVIIYTTETCPFCYRTKEFLKEHKIPFTEKDVGRDRKFAEEMIKKSRQMAVPTIDIDGDIIVGFDEEALRKKLKIKT